MSRRKPGSTLTDKEKMFRAEYIIDLDATNAATKSSLFDRCYLNAGNEDGSGLSICNALNKRIYGKFL